MGVNISLRKLDGTQHPEWDSSRYSGDREVMEVIEANGGTISSNPTFDPWRDPDPMFRPGDFDALAKAQWPEENPERWALLQRTLRDEPDYWLDVSY